MTVFTVSDVVQGYGLHNAGRFYTVVAIMPGPKGRVQLEEHLTGRRFWTLATWYRLAV